MIRNMLLLASVSILTACSTASGPTFSSLEKTTYVSGSKVYVYCTKDISIVGAKAFIDGQSWATLKGHGFIFKNIQAGKHQITILDPNSSTSLIAPPKENYAFIVSKGETKYIKIDWARTGETQWVSGGVPGGLPLTAYKLSFTNVNEASAKNEMSGLHLSQ